MKQSSPTLTLARTARAVAAVAVAGAAAAGLLLTVASQPAEAATGATVYVDKAARYGTCSDTRTRATAGAKATPVCTLARAAKLALPGDTVSVAAGTYGETLSLVSGAAGAPVTWSAEPGAVIDAAGARSAIKAAAVQDVAVAGFAVKGATAQAIWVDAAARVAFTGLTVSGNQAPGIQVRNSSAVSVRGSTISDNLLAGIQELGGVSGSLYSGNVISGNGRDGQAFNGDGIQLDSAGAVVSGNTITDNGNDPVYEHGIYVDDTATGYLIEANTLGGNAATSIKAEGSGTVRGNTMGSSRMAMYVDHSSGTGVLIERNTAMGSYTHALFIGEGAIAQVVNNTFSNDNAQAGIQPTGVFVQAAASLSLRGNLLSARASAGRAVAVPSPAAVAAFSADGNWYAAGSGTLVGIWNGQSVSLADWRTRSGQDLLSVSSKSPVLDAAGRVVGTAATTMAGATAP